MWRQNRHFQDAKSKQKSDFYNKQQSIVFYKQVSKTKAKCYETKVLKSDRAVFAYLFDTLSISEKEAGSGEKSEKKSKREKRVICETKKASARQRSYRCLVKRRATGRVRECENGDNARHCFLETFVKLLKELTNSNNNFQAFSFIPSFYSPYYNSRQTDSFAAFLRFFKRQTNRLN